MREVIYLIAMPALLALGAVCVALIQRLGIVNPDIPRAEKRECHVITLRLYVVVDIWCCDRYVILLLNYTSVSGTGCANITYPTPIENITITRN